MLSTSGRNELSALDTLMRRGEANPRTRSGIMSVEILETTPDWDRLYRTVDDASRRVIRMRQKVVVPPFPTAPSRWVVDPDFDLDHHVHRARISQPATVREVLDMAENMIQSPLDISRRCGTSPWSKDSPRGMPPS
jgi:diacylglycerol O-acyltransferase